MNKLKTGAKNMKKSQETSAKKLVLDEIFNDLYDNRSRIYKMNFFRGIFFGLGSVIGGTVVIALILYILSLLSGVIPGLENFFDAISRLLEEPAEA